MHRKRLADGPTGGAYNAPPDPAGFKSVGRDKGKRKGETTGGDRQLREGDRNEGRALEVFKKNEMRYINPRFTYLLTY